MTTDLSAMTKAAINALLAIPLTASQLKKTSHADLVAMFDVMNAADALDADAPLRVNFEVAKLIGMHVRAHHVSDLGQCQGHLMVACKAVVFKKFTIRSNTPRSDRILVKNLILLFNFGKIPKRVGVFS
jgi:hypothetical protein